jgi:hypothetical protein
VIHSYPEVASAITSRDISLFSVNPGAKGRGLSSDYEGEPSLVERTGGDWLEIEEAGEAALEQMLGGLLTRSDCRQRITTRHAQNPAPDPAIP